MKVDKIKLVIFEENKDIIKVWEDFFHTKYKLCFINMESDQNPFKLDFDKKTIFIFIQGVVVGSIVTIIIFYSLTYKEHERMHDLLEKHGIEKHEH